jgi:outer membrane protein insertion porin family
MSQYEGVLGQGEGRQRSFVIERVKIEGASKTSHDVIRRYLTIARGDTITLDRLLRQLEKDGRRLSQTNFFKEVDYFTEPGSERGMLVVVFDIQERRWPFFQFEGGHNDLDGWFFVPASLRFDNFFGRGNLIGARVVIGDRTSKLAFGYHNPRAFAGRAFFDVELLGGGQDFVHYLGFNPTQQKVDFGGLRLRLGGNVGLFKHLSVGYASENYKPSSCLDFLDADSTTTDLPLQLAKDVADTRIGAISVGIRADSRDNPIYPLKGFWGALSLDFAHDLFGSERDFSKVTIDSRIFHRVSRRNVLALHLKAGYAEDPAPFYQRFFLSGANSLRGYRHRRLTPLGGGTGLFLANAEFRFPISQNDFPFHKVSGVLFFDAGGIWPSGKKPRFDDLFLSVGVGFRVKMPILGITRFDFSFPTTRIDNEDFQFHVSLGHTF